MKKLTMFFLVLIVLISNSFGQVYINEIMVNDGGNKTEFIELIGPSGTDLTGYYIIHYNGADTQDGGLWTHTIGSFTIPNDEITDNTGQNLGFYVLCQSDGTVNNFDERTSSSTKDLQNGPDGIILFDASDVIVDAVAWEGIGDLTIDDPGTVSTEISSNSPNFLHVTTDDNSTTKSLQAPDNVNNDTGSNWILDSSTPGEINLNQTSSDISLPITLSSFTAKSNNGNIQVLWITESEVNNLGFNLYRSESEKGEFIKISDFIEGAGNSSTQNNYSYTDTKVITGHKYYYQLEDVSTDGKTKKHDIISVILEEQDDNIVKDFQLFPAYPNPCNPTTHIRFSIPEQSIINLNIYNLQGQLIKTLISENKFQGTYEVIWNGTNKNNSQVGNGVYLYQLNSSTGYSKTEKIILLK